MNTRTTLLLLAVLAVVGTVAIFVNNKKNDGDDVTKQTDQKLLDISSNDVVKLAVTPASGQKMVFEKKGAAWRLLEPINAAAREVDPLVNSLANLTPTGQVDPSADTGLASPRFQLELTTSAGKTVKLKVGNRQIVGDTLYIQRDGDAKVSIVPARLYEQLDKPLTDYRDKDLVTAQPFDIRQVQITSADGSVLALEKKGVDWEVARPTTMPAESSEVSNITDAIGRLSAVEFVPEAEVPSALNPNNRPLTTIWFSTAAPATQPAAPATQPAGGVTIKVGDFDTVLKRNVYVSVSDPAALAKVAATSVEAFKRKPLDLRDRKVLSVDASLVSRIVLATEKPMASAGPELPHPSTKPASRQELVIERRKHNEPATRPADAAATRPTTEPATTQPTTQQAATQPALPPTDWVMKGAKEGDASQSQVEDLLAKFAPLRAQKYVDGPFPSTQPVQATYTIQITTEKAGTTTQHVVRLQDPGEFKPLLGQYNDLVFEVDRFIADSLTADFANKPKPPEPPPMPPGAGGLPFGHP
jgi:hypothetical protein